MTDLEADVLSAAAMPAHEIRRFESAVWSLYMLSDNPSLPAHCRAACRAAADHAVHAMKPSDRAVPLLVSLVIDVGGGEVAPPIDALVKRLVEIGWKGTPDDLKQAPPPMEGPPPRTLVSDKMRKDALDRILAECEHHLKDNDNLQPQKVEYSKRLDEIRNSRADMRSKTERAWELLEVIERNLYVRTRETGAGG